MPLPKPKAGKEAWRQIMGHEIHDRSYLLLAWQDFPTVGRVFVVPNHAIPADWLDTIWYCHGSYLQEDRSNNHEDTVTSMVRILALLTLPSNKSLPRSKKITLKHTDLVYSTKDLARAWRTYQVLPQAFSNIRKDKVALKIRTGVWKPHVSR